MEEPDEADEYCPHCDNHFLREAVTKGGVVGVGTGQQGMKQDIRKDGGYMSVVWANVFRIVRDDRVEGGGITAKLQAIADSTGRLG